jgi:3-isopropylmalate/(R)-2-methylmalate dehydratase small subunit
MKAVRIVEGRMVPLDRADVDTDQIMPKQFLKRIERTGFGEFLFHDWREDPAFVLNESAYRGASILITGPNFGSGSSREHAPWGLQQYGFEAVVAPSFADIFRNNCARVGLLTVELPEKVCRELMELAAERPDTVARIDLPEQTVTAGGVFARFPFDADTKRLLVEGLDEIALTLQRADAIAAFESGRPAWLPVAGVRG